MKDNYQKTVINYHLNANWSASALPDSFDIAASDVISNVHRFHMSIPGYNPTPLVNLSELARISGVNKIWVKDESKRFDLKAFKVLGASYAMARVLAKRLKMDPEDMTFTGIASAARKEEGLTFVTATDGNHGRAVAWTAEKLGCRSVVYMPKGSSIARLEAIQGFDADASIIDGNFDDAVQYAEKQAKANSWILLQDTSWPGYREIPVYIMQGYFTLLTEFIEQEEQWPTHVFVQAGVGSFAASMLAFLSRCENKPKPVFVVVEPTGAPCLFHSINVGDGKTHRIYGDLDTIMAGLSCGEPSQVGWEILKDQVNAFVTCSDEVARRGMRTLGSPNGEDAQVISGESGAVTLGLVCEVLNNPIYGDLKGKLSIDSDSKILLFSTEGDTDPEYYREVVGE